MKKVIAYCRISLLLLLALGVCGCEFRPLEEPNRGVQINVRVDVNTVVNVTTHIYNEKIPVPDIHPDAMHVAFYEENGDRLVSESFITRKDILDDGTCIMTGYADVLPGTYKMLVYTYGTSYTYVYNSSSWSGINARALQANDFIRNRYQTSVATKGTVPPIITYTPDHVVVASNEKEEIPYNSDSHTIHAVASTVIETYYMQVKVDGLQYVSTARAFLSGMASGNMLSERKPVDDMNTVLFFDMKKSDDKGEPVICSVFNTFGRVEGPDSNVSVTFDIVTVDGEAQSYTVDITDLFETEECKKYHWLLLEDKIKIEKTNGNGGFDLGVNQWEEEEHKIYM